MNKDRIIGLISTAGGVVLAIAASMLPASKMSNDIGPKVFPLLSAGMLIVCGILLILKKSAQQETFLDREQRKKLLIIIGVILLYLVLMWAVGYMVPTFLVLFVLCTLFSREAKVAVWKRILFSAAITGALFFLFRYVLSLRLPAGILF